MTAKSETFTTPALDGVRLHAIHRGDPADPKLLLLSGGGANAHWWDHLAPTLAERFHVVALDFRGHGESDYPANLEVDAFHRDLEALIEHLGSPDVRIAGHSMGSHIALDHAATRGGVVAVVAVDPARGGGRRTRRAMRLALAARRSYATRQEAIDRFRFLPPARGASEPLRCAIAEHSIRREADGRFGFAFDPRWFGLKRKAPADLSQIDCPVLIVRGRDSPVLSETGAAELAAEIPHARCFTVPGAGHNVHLDRPELVLAACLDFL